MSVINVLAQNGGSVNVSWKKQQTEERKCISRHEMNRGRERPTTSLEEALSSPHISKSAQSNFQ